MSRLEGKVALVTGASRGIGAATARLFAREGAKVVAIARNRERLDSVVKSIVDEGFSAYSVVADVTVERNWDHIVETTLATYGKIDILVNNAGVCPPNEGVESCSQELWESIMDINTTAVWYGMKAVIPHMRNIGGGSIVNAASGIVYQGGNDAIAYAASKGGVHSMTKNAAVTLGKYHIRVNAVYPGFIYTEMIQELGFDTFESCADMVKAATPLPPYVGEPYDVAYAYLYLASDESKFVTGAELMVDGGAPVM